MKQGLLIRYSNQKCVFLLHAKIHVMDAQTHFVGTRTASLLCYLLKLVEFLLPYQ